MKNILFALVFVIGFTANSESQANPTDQFELRLTFNQKTSATSLDLREVRTRDTVDIISLICSDEANQYALILQRESRPVSTYQIAKTWCNDIKKHIMAKVGNSTLLTLSNYSNEVLDYYKNTLK